MSKQEYVVKETPCSAYMTIRKKFVGNCTTSGFTTPESAAQPRVQLEVEVSVDFS